MKKALALIVPLFLIVAFSSFQAEARQINWLTNYDEAVKVSRANSKPIVLFFTGSDWCTWCIKLDDEALKTAEFADLAGDKFVFVKVDFPLNRVQPADIVAQNKRLQKQFDVAGFPTIIILDPIQQKQIGSTGYRAGGGRQYAMYLLKMVDDHTAYKQKIENLDNNGLSGSDLRQLYERASELRRDSDAAFIATVGVDSDQKHFFLLERYRILAEQGQSHSDAAIAIKQKLLSSDPYNSKLTHYNVAIIDFESSCRMVKDNTSSEEAVASLEDYIQKFGDKDRDNRWRLQMLISQAYFESNHYAEALKYAQSSYQSAPPAAQQEIATAIHSIEAKIPH